MAETSRFVVSPPKFVYLNFKGFVSMVSGTGQNDKNQLNPL